jgi:hypothetical protein
MINLVFLPRNTGMLQSRLFFFFFWIDKLLLMVNNFKMKFYGYFFSFLTKVSDVCIKSISPLKEFSGHKFFFYLLRKFSLLFWIFPSKKSAQLFGPNRAFQQTQISGLETLKLSYLRLTKVSKSDRRNDSC